MKKMIFAVVATAAVCLPTGFGLGWLFRKKVSEVQFVECTEEEQQAQMIANGDGNLIPVNKDAIERPVDIQQAIDGVFGKADIPEDLKEKVSEQVKREESRESGIRQMDTQKVQYMKMWKQEGEAIAEKYDTRSKEDDVTELPEDTKKFMDEIGEDEDDEDAHFGDGRPPIEPADEEDWDRWESKQDGAYDCVEVYWFTEDDRLSDDESHELTNPGKFLGFDPRKMFENEPDEGEDPDIRYVYNHKQPAIFKLIRRNTSFSRKRGMEEYGSDYDGDEDDSEDYIRSRH